MRYTTDTPEIFSGREAADSAGAASLCRWVCGHRMDVLARGLVCPGAAQVGGALVVEFDEDDGAVDAVVKDAFCFDTADPGKVSRVQIALHFIHLCLRVAVLHVANIKIGKFD